MLSRILSSAVVGIEAFTVDVEVDIAHGLPSLSIVGLPETAVKESRERVKAAIKNSGYVFPDDRITVNLAPAHIKKEGTGFDLPIALGILDAAETWPRGPLHDFLFLGELSLDGGIKPVFGALPIAAEARKKGFKGIVVPYANRKEAAVVEGLAVHGARNLIEVVEFLRGAGTLRTQSICLDGLLRATEDDGEDFADVKGQEHIKRALEIAAAGGHNLLMIGPPGAGKTMLARRLPSIMPPPTFEEAIETTKIFSVAGMLSPESALIAHRIFRSPHHTISDAGLIGGGAVPKPGEVSLAHNGVLFLDELPEYKRHVLEVLRQPLEDRKVTISRANSSVSYPSDFMLVAAMNPCPCGYLTDPKRGCSCTARQVQRYRARISGPLLDRIDLHVHVPALSYRELTSAEPAPSSREIRRRVVRARAVQTSRLAADNVGCNARMASRHIRKHCRLDPASHALLEKAIQSFGFSARAYFRIVKIARTIADLHEEECIGVAHVSEAIQYRDLDRGTAAARLPVDQFK